MIDIAIMAGVVLVVLILIAAIFSKMYIVCPSDSVMIIDGMGSGSKMVKTSSGSTELQTDIKIYRGGGKLVIPGLQKHSFLKLEPIQSQIKMNSALTSNNVPVDVQLQLQFVIDPANLEQLKRAATYFAGKTTKQIEMVVEEQAIGAMRNIISTMTIEQMISDREKFNEAVHDNLTHQLEVLGLKLLGSNIRDIRDQSNYIESLGRKAIAQVTERAKIDVAELEKVGQIETAQRERDRVLGVQAANNEQQLSQAKFQRDREIGLKTMQNERELAIQKAETQRLIALESDRREAEIQTAEIAASAAQRTSESKMRVAAIERDVALAEFAAQQSVAEGRKDAMIAELAVDRLAEAQINYEEQIIAARLEAERNVIEATSEADALALRMAAEGKGTRAILEEKAAGLKSLIDAAGGGDQAIQYLLVEKFEDVARLQVEALKGLKIDSVTIWGGNGENGSGVGAFTNDFVRALPPLHEIAKNAGIKLPAFMGQSAQDVLTDGTE